MVESLKRRRIICFIQTMRIRGKITNLIAENKIKIDYVSLAQMILCNVAH